MSISMKRYVDITSGVGGALAVRARDLIGRLFTTNPLVPTGSLIEFGSADEVGLYFGTTSAEYKRAAFYFGWISKSIGKANKISFARWADVATLPQIYGAKLVYTLTQLKAITAGKFTITLGGDTHAVTGLDFSAATSLADIATTLQTTLRALAGAQFAGVTVTYDATRGGFNLVGTVTGTAPVSVEAGPTDDASAPLGWLTGAIFSDGANAETLTDVLTASTNASNNFASFLFMPTLTAADVLEVASWNDTQNVMFHYCVPVSASDAAAYYGALSGLSGVSMTLSPLANEFPEMVPMIIMAATDYSKRNSTQNYMYQQFTLTPSVTTDADANLYDPLRINYYGRTQTAGQNIDFYQRGVMCGLATDPVDMNTYANETWFKDRCGSAIMELLLSMAKVSANTVGRSQIMAVVQSAINEALNNGTISVGKPLNPTQKLYIGTQTGDDLAWMQVQNIGYWLDCSIKSYVTTSGTTEYKAVYACIYSKDDCIRKVEGTHTLI